MIQKIQNQAIERGRGEDLNRLVPALVHRFLEYKIVGLSKGIVIPDNLVAEADKFINRNIVENSNFECCLRCLKAHVLKKAAEMSLTDEQIYFLGNIFPGEAGHDGYYLDNEKLIKISGLSFS